MYRRERERERKSVAFVKKAAGKKFCFSAKHKKVSLFAPQKNLSASPLRFEFLHDFQKLIVRLLPIFQALFPVSQITQRVLLSRGVVHLRPLSGRRVQPVSRQNIKVKKKKKKKKVSALSPKARVRARERKIGTAKFDSRMSFSFFSLSKKFVPLPPFCKGFCIFLGQISREKRKKKAISKTALLVF